MPLQVNVRENVTEWVTTLIIKPDGTRVKGYDYDEFGNLSEVGESGFKNEIKFTGSVYDEASALDYMNARFYNPNTGRFLSQDTYTGSPYEPATQHLYSYCGNNPVSMTDPTGHYYPSDRGSNKPVKSKNFIGPPAPTKGTGNPIVKKEKSVGTQFLNGTQNALDLAGLIPAIGIVPDFINVGIYAIRGDKTNYYISLAAMVPVVGVGATAAKLAKKVNKADYIIKGASKTQFKSQDLLDTHYQKHVVDQGEFGNISKSQYLENAQGLVNSKPGGNILSKTRTNGDTIVYNKVTNEFAVSDKTGNIKTYFKPSNGINYYNNQK